MTCQPLATPRGSLFCPGSATKLHIVTADEQRSLYRRNAVKQIIGGGAPVCWAGLAWDVLCSDGVT
jgi:hypothetical protein